MSNDFTSNGGTEKRATDFNALSRRLRRDGAVERRHNETDFEKYNAFLEEQAHVRKLMDEERARERAKARRANREEQLKKFDKMVPSRFRGNSLRHLFAKKDASAVKIVNKVTKSQNKSIFINQENAIERERNAYALMRDYIEMGAIQADDVCFFSDNELSVMATTGFTGYGDFRTKTKNGSVKAYVVQGFRDKAYTPKEMRLLEEILYDCIRSDKIIIVTSTIELAEFERILTPDGFQYLRELVKKNSLSL